MITREPFDSEAIDDPDKPLVAQAKNELPYRTESYEALMRRHENILYRVCYRILANSHDAEDVCQEVMVKAFNGIARFEFRSTFKTWLLTIAHNTCYSAIEKIKRAKQYETYFEHHSEDASIELSTAAIDGEKILFSLPAQERELLTLKYVAELKFEEIAAIFNLSLSATKMRIYRATENLKKHYNS